MNSAIDQLLCDLEWAIARYRAATARRRQIANLIPLVEAAAQQSIDEQCDAIARYVAAAHGLDPALLYRRDRAESIVLPRQLAHYFARHFTVAGYSALGRHFNRDHGAIMYSCQAVKDRCQVDPAFAAHVQALKSALAQLRSQPLNATAHAA